MTTTSTRSKKIRAIAAGGAVLGLGAVITLAAWSDSEFAQGQFASGTFGIQAATDGEAFSEHSDEAGALELTPAALAMSPGETVAYPYQIRLVDNSADATVEYVGNTRGADDALTAEDLSVNVLQIADTTCDENTTGTPLAESGAFALTETSPQQNLCIQVTLDPEYDTLAPESAEIMWQFTATETTAAE